MTQPQPHAEEAPVPTGPRLKVLVVEDDAILRLSTAGMVSDLGHEAAEAATPAEALALLDQGGFDVMKTDVGLPGMTGIELANEARRRCSGLHVIVVTGYSGRALRIETLKSSGIRYLGKPYGSEQLRRVLDGCGRAAPPA